MCQRVLIAMAFASKPKLVIADEPTTALDVTIQARIVRLIAEMQERDNTAVLFITHDLRLAAQVCDDILVLYAGRAAEYGPARKVFGAPGHPYTRCLQLANPAMTRAARALCAARAHAGPARLARSTGCAFAPRCPSRSRTAAARRRRSPRSAPAHVAACIRADAHARVSRRRAAPPAETPAAAPPILEVSALEQALRLGRAVPPRPNSRR